MGGGSGSLGVAQSVIVGRAPGGIYEKYYYATYDLMEKSASFSKEIDYVEMYNIAGGEGAEEGGLEEDGVRINFGRNRSWNIKSAELNQEIFDRYGQSTHTDGSVWSELSYTVDNFPDSNMTIFTFFNEGEEQGDFFYAVDVEKETVTLVAKNIHQLLSTYRISPDKEWILFLSDDDKVLNLARLDGSSSRVVDLGLKRYITLPMWAANSSCMYWMGDPYWNGKSWQKILQIDPVTLESKTLLEGSLIMGYNADINDKRCFRFDSQDIFYCGSIAIDVSQTPPQITTSLENFPMPNGAFLHAYWFSPDRSKVFLKASYSKEAYYYVVDGATGKVTMLEGIPAITNQNPWSPDGRLIVVMQDEYPDSIYDSLGQDNRQTNLLIYDVEKMEVVSTIPIEADGELFPIWVE